MAHDGDVVLLLLLLLLGWVVPPASTGVVGVHFHSERSLRFGSTSCSPLSMSGCRCRRWLVVVVVVPCCFVVLLTSNLLFNVTLHFVVGGVNMVALGHSRTH